MRGPLALAATPRRGLSIALRMSAWYAVSAFALVLAATGFLYWVLASNFEREDARFARDELDNVRLMLSRTSASPGLGTPGVAADADHELFVRVIDASGVVRLETPGMARVVRPPDQAALGSIHDAQPVRQDVRSGDGGIFQTLTATASADGRHANGFVQIAMNLGDEERLLSLYRERMALVLGLALIATALVGYLIARGGMQPIQRIGTAAARIGSSTLHERIETRDLPAELGGLAEAFNTMLDRLENAFARVSRFSDDAAHELRTPINNLRGEIEVALSRPRSKEDYQQVLGSSLEECSRISRIIEGLLFLARTEAATDELRREEVDVGEALEAVREFYEAAASDKGAALAVIFAPDLRARLDRTLFQQAVGNLVSNAIAHTPPGGTIALEARRGEDALLVVVADTGCGIAEQHLPHVFDRFYRVDRARSGGEHVGLGLAVVRSIVERHGGCAEIDSTLGGGARVQLIFPD